MYFTLNESQILDSYHHKIRVKFLEKNTETFTLILWLQHSRIYAQLCFKWSFQSICLEVRFYIVYKYGSVIYEK